MNVRSNMESFIAEFRSNEDKAAIIWRDEVISYGRILTRIDYWRKELKKIKPNTIVGLEGDFSPETIAILFVLIERNTIIVPLDIKHSKKNVKKCSIAQLQILIRVNGEDDIKINLLENNQQLHELYDHIIQRKAPGLVLFTSGSSGEPKAALHDFSKLLDKFKNKRKALKTINFLLFDHWGGLNTLFHVLSCSGTIIILDNRKPDYVCELIEKHKVELLPTSPTFLNMMLMSRAYKGRDLSSLKIISYGAEPMPEYLLKHLNFVFPNVKLQQTYGLIELGVMRSKSENNNSLWVKIGGEGFQTRVVNGLLEIKSDSAMIGYLNAESPYTEDGWFKTGDSVEIKGEYVKILGRKSEMINVGGEKVFPQEVENVILEIPEISDVLVYGGSNPLTGKIVCAKISYNGDEAKSEIIKRVKRYCREKLEPFKVPVKVEFTETTFENDRFKKSRTNEK